MGSLSTIRDAVLLNLLRRNPSQEDQDAATSWINQTLREEVCARRNWASMFSRQSVYLTAGVDRYQWPDPTVWKATMAIGIRTDVTTPAPFLKLQEAHEMQVLYDNPSTTQMQPVWWSRTSDGFRVRPTPDQSNYYQIDVVGWKYPGELVADGDTNDFTTNYSQLLERMVTARGWLHFGEDRRAQQWKSLADEALVYAIAVDVERMTEFEKNITLSGAAGSRRLPARNRFARVQEAYSWF